MKKSQMPLSRLLLIPLLSLVTFLVSSGAAISATTTDSWQNITANLTTTKTTPLYDLARNVYTSQLSVKNSPSIVPIAGMVRAVITASSKSPLNPDGTSDDGKPYYLLVANQQASLGVNQSTLPRAISFPSSRGAVTYSVRIENWQLAQLKADLTISKAHGGNFTQGQTGAVYTLTANNIGAGPTNGLVTVTDTLPANLTATAISGPGWSCSLATLSCTRSDALSAGSSYPDIALTVNVGANAAANVSNIAAISGGGEVNIANNSAVDLTTITPVVQQAGIQVTPSPLPFGAVTLNTSKSLQLTISNSGTADLTVSSINGLSAPFSIFPPTNFTIAAGASRQVDIGFAPAVAGNASGTLVITSNAANQNPVNVTVSGNGVAPQGSAQISAPTAVDFGAVQEGLTALKDVTVSNKGTAPLIVSQAIPSGSGFGFALNTTPVLPLTITPNQSVNLQLALTPGNGTGGSTLAGALALTSNGGSASVALSGSAVTPVTQPPSQAVLGARVKNGSAYDSITAASCPSVGGEVQFGSGSVSSDNFIVTLTDQGGATAISASLPAVQGAGIATFSGIAACGLKDGTIGVTVTVNSLSPATGTAAAKNTSTTFGPIVLNPVASATVFSTIQVCGTAPLGSLVQITGGSGSVSLQLPAVQSTFCQDVPLRLNTENLLIASATDTASGQVATATPVKVNQVDPSSVLIATASSRPLTTAEVETLVQNGVINLNDPSNFNVSMFTIVLTIGQFPVTISQPVVVNPTPGSVSYGAGGSGGGGSGWGGGGGDGGGGSSSQIVVIQTPTGQTIPGVIIIDGRIKTLKEFFQVTIAIQNITTQFDLTDMNAKITLPAGLSPVKAGLGTDVANINTGSATDTVNMGLIGPSQTGTGQFIIRGDGIGTHNVTVNFDGFLSGGGLPSPTPISGLAGTSVQVFGPPKLDVVVRHPGNPGVPANDVTAGEIYTLTVEITNKSQVPALYTSLQLLIGQGAKLVDQNGVDIPGSSTEVGLGHIQPGQTVSQAFRVKALLTGKIIACQAVTSENINLTVDTGGGSCNIANTIPVNFQFPPANAPPVVMAINPLNNQQNIVITSSFMAILTPQAACLTPDIWNNVVTDWIDPTDHTKGIQVVSADLVSMGTFYLEELDSFSNPVRHIPTDLTLTTGVDGKTTIAVLRLGLPGAYSSGQPSQYFLKPSTAYRATLVGGANGICNANVSSATLATTFQWTFSTVQTCTGIAAPLVTMSQPLNGSTNQPLNQKMVLDFTNKMNPGSFSYDPVTPLNSSFLVLSGGTVSGGDVTGGTIVPGTAAFSALFKTFTYTPTGNLPQGTPVYIRLKSSIKDICGNPLQTPVGGIKLLSFTTIPPDTTPPNPPVVNPLSALTSLPAVQISGSAEASSTVTITGGASTITTTASGAGLFNVSVPLNLGATNNLQVKAKDASNNESSAVMIDKNGAPLSVVNDSTAPLVASLSIPNGAANLPRNPTITVTMNEPINLGTVNDLNFKLEGSVIPGTFTLINATIFSFMPDALLDFNKTYTIRMRAGGISDLAGNSLASDYVSTFSTTNYPVPTLTLLNPASGTQGTTFNVTFTGTNLASASAVVSANPGVSGSISSTSDASVVASITVNSLAATGPTTLGLTTLGGTVTLPFTVNQKAPIINTINLNNGNSGATVNTQIAGSGLSSLSSLTISGAGVTITQMPGGNDSILNIQLVIDAGAATGSRIITITTTGGTATTAFIINSASMSLSLVGTPVVGVGHSATLRITLAQPAPVSGATITVTSDNSGVLTVTAPGTVNIQAGGTTGDVIVNGISAGNVTVRGNSAGYSEATLGATVTGSLISLASGLVVGPEQSLDLALNLTSPAPAGGVTVNLTSANTAVSTVTSSVFVPAGATIPTANPKVIGVAIGTTQINATASGYASASSTVKVAINLSLTPTSLTVPRTNTVNISLNLSAPAPAAGITFNVSTDNPATATAPATVTATGGVSSLQIPITGVAVGSTTLRISAPGISEVTAPISVSAAPALSMGSQTVGKDLQVGLSVSLAAPAPAGNLPVTITSSDPTKVLLSTSANTVGSGSITLTVPAGSSGTAAFYVQSLDRTGSYQLTATAAGFATGTSTVTLVPSGFANVTSTINTTTLSPDTAMTLYSAQLDPTTLNYAGVQSLRGGLTVNVPVTSSNTTVGTVVGSPAVFTGGGLYYNNSVALHPLTAGSTIISLGVPAGFDTPNNYQQITANVSSPALTMGNPTVGRNLQTTLSVSLGAPAPTGGLSVTITSANNTKILLSTSATTVGSGSITLTVPAGSSGTAAFYVQALDRTGSYQLTATAAGFATGTSTVTLVPSGFANVTSTINTTTLSPDTAMTLYSAQLDPTTLNYAGVQSLRGGLTVNVPVTSSNTTVGTVVGSPAVFTGGGLYYNNSVALHPLTAGSTIISLGVPAGFDTPNNYQQITANVSSPALTMGNPTVGRNLQTTLSVSLGAPAPTGGLSVTITSANNTKVLLSTSATTVGSGSITLTVPAGSSGTAAFYVQSLDRTGSYQLTATAAGFTTGTSTVTLVPSGFANVTSTINAQTLAPDTAMTLYSAQLDPTTLNYAGVQSLRGGLTVNVPVTSSNTTVGTVVGSPAVFTGGGLYYNNSTSFHPLSAGTAIISLGVPAGFDTPSNYQQVTANVTGITIPSGQQNLSLLAGTSATASTIYSASYNASLAIDGVNSTNSSWCTANNDLSPVLSVAFTSGVSVGSIDIVTSYSPTYDFMTGRFRLYNAANTLIYDSGLVTLTSGAINHTLSAPVSGVRRAEFIGASWNSVEPCLSELVVVGTNP